VILAVRAAPGPDLLESRPSGRLFCWARAAPPAWNRKRPASSAGLFRFADEAEKGGRLELDREEATPSNSKPAEPRGTQEMRRT
jgi:hypothetical protein